MKEITPLEQLRRQFPGQGAVQWLGLRKLRKAPVTTRSSLQLVAGQGIAGDHYAGRSGRRHVTLIDAAHLDAVAGYLGLPAINPADVRRNIVTSGVNLLALKHTRFRLGDALLEYTDECHPCSRMEQVLGVGGYNAMRGHGGICARILVSGDVALGDSLVVDGFSEPT